MKKLSLTKILLEADTSYDFNQRGTYSNVSLKPNPEAAARLSSEQLDAEGNDKQKSADLQKYLQGVQKNDPELIRRISLFWNNPENGVDEQNQAVFGDIRKGLISIFGKNANINDWRLVSNAIAQLAKQSNPAVKTEAHCGLTMGSKKKKMKKKKSNKY